MPEKLTIKGVWALAIAAAFVVLAVGLAVQTARIEGFKVWPISVKGYKAENKDLKDQLHALVVAQDLAAKAQKAVNDGAAAAYKSIAKDVDHEYKEKSTSELANAERYISDHRVRASNGTGAASQAASASASDGPRGSQAGSAAPQLDGSGTGSATDQVAVTADDIRICTRNTLQAEAARTWALQLEEASQEK